MSLLLLLVPLTYALSAMLPEGLFARRPEHRWTVSLFVAGAAFVVSLGAAATIALAAPTIGQFALPGRAGLAIGVRLDALTAVMLPLITGISALILRFSQRYLHGERGRASYVRWFLATMAVASLLVITNDLLVLALAWTAWGISLHQLLTFYGDRAPALIAAHKKFLLSRVADVVIFAALFMIWRAMGTQRIDAILAQSAAMTDIPTSLQLAGVLLVTGVGIRSAQLPFHGWLIQVMEAPTPVSALLHAGIVNIGGFVLIRLSGLLGKLDAAQTLLVVAGTTTAVLASLVMTTRVSVKVSLAWSTCAQMGFMLLECGLGAYGLALLHLVAHSLYKAHAFLSSGRAVEQQLRRRMTPLTAHTTLSQWILGAIAAGVIVGSIGVMLGLDTDADIGTRAAMVILTLALAPLFVHGIANGSRSVLRAAISALVLVASYALGHAAFTSVVPDVQGAPALALVRFGIVVTAFIALYLVQATIASYPAGKLARALYPACFAGFYVDEIWTRLTFRIWPPRSLPLPPKAATTSLPIFLELPA